MARPRTTNASGRKKPRKRAKKKYWSADVKTVSTFPPEGTFNKSATSIARTLSSKKVSPKGIGSGLRMLQFFINRAGKDLPAQRRKVLEQAKGIMREKLAKERKKAKAPRKAKGKSKG